MEPELRAGRPGYKVRDRDRPKNRNFQHDYGGVARWKATTPKVLQDAIQAGWNGTATPAQKRLLKNWVTARVMDVPIPRVELLIAHLAALDERSSNTRPGSPATGGSTRNTSPDS